MKTEKVLIVNQICSCIGSNESSKVELVADTKTGETRLVISKTIKERYPITDYDKVMRLYEKLNNGRGSGWTLEEIVNNNQ